MRPFVKTFLASAVLALAVSPALAVDPFFPTFGNPGIDVHHYNIDLDVDPVSGRISGQSSLIVEAKQGLNSFSLDLHGLIVSKVIVNGRHVRFSQANDKVNISGFGFVPKGRHFFAAISYAGVPDPLPDPTVEPGSGIFLGWFKYQNSTYVVSEPLGASSFFPANDDITDKATYTFGVTVPKGYTGVANGSPIGHYNFGSKERFQWAMLRPMEAWLATVHVNKFNLKTTRTPNGIPVRAYYPDGVPESHADVYLLASQMIPYFESKVGRYPFASYGTAVSQDPALYYFLETQAMSTFPAETNLAGLPDEAIVAHELAHQWFGNSVSVAKWEDLWIAEGLATYFEVLWPNRNDPAAFDAGMRDIYDTVVQKQIGAAVVDTPDQLFSDRTYLRGGSAMYALQLKVGQPMLFQILRQFVRENRGGTVNTGDFIRTAVRVSRDPSVRALLQAWLYETPVPTLPGSATARTGVEAKRAPSKVNQLLGMRCGRGSHRGAPKTCDTSQAK
jgi:aminopeptidase N